MVTAAMKALTSKAAPALPLRQFDLLMDLAQALFVGVVTAKRSRDAFVKSLRVAGNDVGQPALLHWIRQRWRKYARMFWTSGTADRALCAKLGIGGFTDM